MDLEDAVAVSAKESAREILRETITPEGKKAYGNREIIIRINSLDTPWGLDDLEVATRSAADGIAIPKVECASMVQQVANAMDYRGMSDEVGIWAMIETPKGVLASAEIAASSPRLFGLVMGTSDLSAEVKVSDMLEPSMVHVPLLYARSHVVIAARASEVLVLDGVFLNLKDDEETSLAFERECLLGKSMGFDGKTIIHPKQMQMANATFTPLPGEVQRSRQIIQAHQKAENKGQGVVLVDGKLIENLHVRQAYETLQLAEVISQRAV